MAAKTRSATRASVQSTMTLLALPNELLRHVLSLLVLAEHKVQTSMTCKLLNTEVTTMRELWCSIEFSHAAARRITDTQLADFLERIRAREYTKHICLQFTKICGTGLLPLLRSNVLHTLDLRQAHGPCASYHGERYWDGAALLSLLEDFDKRESRVDECTHIFLPLVMAPDSVGHPWVDLVDVEDTASRIHDLMIGLKRTSPCCDNSVVLGTTIDVTAAIECSVCLESMCAADDCNECEHVFVCSGCTFTACSSCEPGLPWAKRCENEDCPQWLCTVCAAHSLMTCVSCSGLFCERCGRDGDEAPEGDFYCTACEDAYWEEAEDSEGDPDGYEEETALCAYCGQYSSTELIFCEHCGA